MQQVACAAELGLHCVLSDLDIELQQQDIFIDLYRFCSTGASLVCCLVDSKKAATLLTSSHNA